MKLLPAWKRYFAPVILSRGWSYFQDGAIISLEETESSASAIVVGSESYKVEIGVVDGILNMSCTCPYSNGNVKKCKHMAAVCFAIDNQKSGKAVAKSKEMGGLSGRSTNESKKATKSASKMDSKSISIETASEDELRTFLLELASKDRNLRKKFEAWIYNLCPQSEIDKWVGTLSGSIDEVFSTADEAFLYGSDSIYYENECDESYDDSIYSFQHDLDDAFDFFTVRGHNDVMFQILCDMYAYAESVNSDGGWDYADSGDEALVQVQIPILETIQKLLTLPVSSELHDRIYTWVRKVLKDIAEREYSGCSNEERIWDLFFSDLQSLEVQKETLQMVDSLLEIDVTTLLLEKKFQLMESLGYLLDEIEAAEEPYLDVTYVYTRRIDRAVADGRYRDAAEILAKHLKQEYPGMDDIKRYRRLAELYELAGEMQLSENLRRDILATSSADMEDYLAYRGLFSPVEWEKLRDAAMAVVSDRYMNQVLCTEQMYEKLFARLKDDDIHELLKYEHKLAKLYPNEILQIRLTTACGMMTYASSREVYRDVLSILDGSLKYDSGVAQVTEILTSWIDIHKRRRALWDELHKFTGLHRIWSSITGK